MIDVKRERARIAQLESEWSSGISFGAERSELCAGYVAALDELEASRKQVAPCRFDVADARAELARIDGVWSTGQINTWDAKKATRSILDRALAAIDAGWSVQSIDAERAALAGWTAAGGTASGWAHGREDRENALTFTRAVLAYAGRRVEPTIITDVPQSSPMGPAPNLIAPVAITDAIVEEAAILAWCAPWDGRPRTVGEWHDETSDEQLDTYRNEARAVLEYAASLGGVVPAQTVPLAPAVDPRAERLTRYRCAVANAQVASHETWEALWLRSRAFDSMQTFGEWCAEQCEARAHAMLAAEKEPTRG